MRIVTLLTIGLILSAVGCSNGPQENAITLVNTAVVETGMLERIRAFAEQELNVPVRVIQNPKLAGKADFAAMEKAARRVKKSSDAVLIVLSDFSGESRHLAVLPSKGVALINVQALYTADAETFARRIERQVMRAAAFSLGLTPTPDPFCVTRDYNSLEDLDTMGRNFSPPWQGRFAEEAEKRGLLAPDAAREKRVIPPTE